ncbi:MAG TPA: hypothetical protein ENJ95_12150 [Bacteroidetes bacterium]|nr:hypothetical protein [Bacteroidota bacterium]
MKTSSIAIILCILFVGCTSEDKHADEQPPLAKKINTNIQAENISSDFDFLLGEWDVISKRRKKWLVNNDEWIPAEATCKVWKQLGGMLVMDEFHNTRNGKEQVSSTLRIYNPNKKEWTLYWLSTAFPNLGLMPQVKGSFKNGTGRFFGEEDFNGKKVKLRFLWKISENGTPHWEQAYFDKKNNEWETNWIMDFTKKK